MRRWHSSAVRWIGALTLAWISTSPACADAQLQVSNGILMGARSVSVGTQVFDVTFSAGCAQTLFTCNTGYVFSSQGEAAAASQALLDQVLLDKDGYFFDSAPGLTHGCVPSLDWGTCNVLTPFLNGGNLGAYGAANSQPSVNGVTGQLTDIDSTGIYTNGVHVTVGPPFLYATLEAQWHAVSAVPEAPTALLWLSGGLALAMSVRRRPVRQT